METRRMKSISAALFLVLASITAGLAGVPQTINYQGYLKDSAGMPVNSPVNVTFRLYSSGSGASPLWSGVPQSVTPSNGIYSTQIGPAQLPFDRRYYLGVSVESDPEMKPLQALDAAPYAMRAATADAVPDSSIGSAAIADSSVTDAKISGPISAAKLDLSSRVAKTGDTMTGILNLPANGLVVGSNQLVVSGTNVGIGTASPASKLDVNLGSTDALFTGYGANNAGLRLVNTDVSTRTWALWALGNSGTWGPAKGFAIGDVTAGAARLVIDTTGNLGYGANSKPGALFSIGGSVVQAPWGAHLLEVSGTTRSSSAGQAYHKGLYVAPTFDVSVGYANYLTGIETYMGGKTGTNVAHSVVGYHLNGQPTSGNTCSVGFGISVPNQNTALCNGRYGFYQGDTAAQYNYFASSVGIGTPFPTQALDVSGTVKATAFQGNGSGLSNITAVNVSGTVAVANGGTGATSAPTALTNLGAVAKAGDTMTGTLNLPVNGLQMAGNQISTSGSNFGYGVAAKSGTLFTIGGSVTVPAPTTWGAHLLEVSGTTRSSSAGQAYHKGIYVAPTFDVSVGYANYLTGIETYMGGKTGTNVAHSVVGYHLNGQPTSGNTCSVGFGISVPNQNTALCNGRYGFYQGDTAAQYNYFASSVGIGTPFPTQALDVQGNALVSGNISAAGTGTMPVYDNTGAARNAPHMVTGTVAVNGSAVVSLSGAAAFSTAGSYLCTATAVSSPAPIAVQNSSGSSFTINAGFSGNVNYICVGN